MMKKWMAISLLLGLFLGLGACGAVRHPSPTSLLTSMARSTVSRASWMRSWTFGRGTIGNMGCGTCLSNGPTTAPSCLTCGWERRTIPSSTSFLRIGPGLRGTPQNKAFYQSIKVLCPETVFHGTDIGFRHYYAGPRYLAYLRENGLEDSEPYSLTE